MGSRLQLLKWVALAFKFGFIMAMFYQDNALQTLHLKAALAQLEEAAAANARHQRGVLNNVNAEKSPSPQGTTR